MLFKNLRKRKEEERLALSLYQAVVDRAREKVFYAELGVPDSLDGRFELISLHLFLLLNRLKGEGLSAERASRDLYDTFFADMDLCLREMGAGDLGVGHKVQRMAEGFFGRLKAYDRACVEACDKALSDTLRRNLFGTLEEVDEASLSIMTGYVRRNLESLAAEPLASLLDGELEFAEMPSS